MKKFDEIHARLADERGKEVIFLSHCLLNINTRYLGGAFRRGSVEEIIAGYLNDGVGIVQMKCPEQLAWGGVYKKILWKVFGTDGKTMRFFKPFVLKLFIAYTRCIYRRIAADVAKTILAYTRAGIKVRGIVGVDGSPTCGVNMRLDMNRCFDYFMEQRPESLNRSDFNTGLYLKCASEGPGLYMEILQKKLKKLNILFYRHSLMLEMENKTDVVDGSIGG